LLTYGDVRKRAAQIVKVTSTRYMPPWLPDAGTVRFQDERILTDGQIALFRLWARQGLTEGERSDLPPRPTWTRGWELGQPDLVVTMPDPFTMPASGPDVYRNFVIPIPLDAPQWVRAMELRPGNKRIVHHAFMLTDSTRTARKLQAEDSLPGYEGMDVRGAQAPEGHFVGWQPGRRPYSAPDGMAWKLNPGTDLVLQVHMQPTGKSETIQASIGFFFSREAPTEHPFKLVLRSEDIDVPAGEKNYTFQESYVLPVDVDALAITAHAHYLGKGWRPLALCLTGPRNGCC
jgi:hypothetical protein